MIFLTEQHAYQQYDGDDENVFPLTETGMWKPADKFDLLGTWKVCCMNGDLMKYSLYDKI